MDVEAKKITIFCNNVFLIPWSYLAWLRLVRSNRVEILETCTHQDIRAKELIKMTKDFDFIVLQEMWGAEAEKIYQSHQDTHEILERNAPWQFPFSLWGLEKLFSYFPTFIYESFYFSTARELLTAKRFKEQKNGGLYLANKKTISKRIWEVHHTFRSCSLEESIFKSCNLTLFDMNPSWPNQFLLIVNTHLYSPNPYEKDGPRKDQREEIRELLVKIQSQLGLPYPDTFSWDQCGVLIMGDFNTAFIGLNGEMNEEYKQTLTSFGPGPLRDLLLEVHPDSDHHTYDSKNPYVSQKEDCARLDYIFALDSLPASIPDPSISIPLLKLKCLSYHIYSEPESGQHLSDHYPLNITVVPSHL